MIKRAEPADAETAARMGLRFIEAAGLPPANLEGCINFCHQLISSDNGVIFVSDLGVIAGYAAPIYYNPGYVQAHEVFWWAEDKQGSELFRFFERWAIDEIEADEIVVSTLRGFSPDHLLPVLLSKGYKERDLNFVKGLS